MRFLSRLFKRPSQSKNEPKFDDLADAGPLRFWSYMLLPLLVALGFYVYCEWREPNCGEKQQAENPKAKCSIPCHIVNRALDDAVALFTGVLVYVVYIQLLFMNRQETWLRRSWKAAAFQARVSNRAFLSLNRPRIKVRHLWAVGDLWGGGKIAIRVQIVNVGLTTAKIVEYSATTLLLGSDRPLPPVPHYGYKIEVRVDPNLESGHSADIPAEADLSKLQDQIRPISDDDNAAIRGGEKKLYAIGYVKYEDSEHRPITTAFCRVLQPATGVGSFSEIGRFVPLPKEDSNYEYQD